MDGVEDPALEIEPATEVDGANPEFMAWPELWMFEPAPDPATAPAKADATAPALAKAPPAPDWALADAKAVASGNFRFFRSTGPPEENALELLYAKKILIYYLQDLHKLPLQVIFEHCLINKTHYQESCGWDISCNIDSLSSQFSFIHKDIKK